MARLNPAQARSPSEWREPRLALGSATINLSGIRFCGTGELLAGSGGGVLPLEIDFIESDRTNHVSGSTNTSDFLYELTAEK